MDWNMLEFGPLTLIYRGIYNKIPISGVERSFYFSEQTCIVHIAKLIGHELLIHRMMREVG